jgi:hypothetical protein
LTFEVFGINDAPDIITVSLPDAIEDIDYSYQIEALDIDSNLDDLIWGINETDAEFIQIDISTGEISGSPTNEDVGDWWISILVTDDYGSSDEINLTLTVRNVNDDPTIETMSIADQKEDKTISIELIGYDIDPTDDQLTWSIEDTDAEFLTIDPSTGNLSGTPTNDDVGAWYVVMNLSDGNGGFAVRNFTFSIIGVNDPPELLVDTFHLSGYEDNAVSFNLETVFTDIDGDPLSYSYSISNNFTISITEENVSITPKDDWSGTEIINFNASDGEYWISIDVVFIIDPVNDAPFDAVINALSSYEELRDQIVSGSASDVDIDFGDELTYTWFSNISGEIGVGETINLSLTAGKHLITLNVTDKSGAFTTASKEIEILPISNDQQNKQGGSDFPWWMIIVIAVVILLVFIIMIFVIIRKKNQNLEKTGIHSVEDQYQSKEQTPEYSPQAENYYQQFGASAPDQATQGMGSYQAPAQPVYEDPFRLDQAQTNQQETSSFPIGQEIPALQQTQIDNAKTEQNQDTPFYESIQLESSEPPQRYSIGSPPEMPEMPETEMFGVTDNFRVDNNPPSAEPESNDQITNDQPT